MPFKSRAQVRKFYALKGKGKMSQAEIDKWASETPKKASGKLDIPEESDPKKRKSFESKGRYARKSR